MVERPDRAVVGTFLVRSLDSSGGDLTLATEVAHHLRVRRVAPGASLRLTDGAGRSALATLSELTKHGGRAAIEQVERSPAQQPLHLLAPVADRDRTLWLAEKAVELGITHWTPVRWQRSRSVGSRGEGEAFRNKLRGRMAAALEQSGGSWLPAVDAEMEPDALPAMMGMMEGAECFVLDALGEPMLDIASSRGTVVLALGPEGGFEPDEVGLLRAAGFRGASLGSATLRFETAGVAALALMAAMRASASRAGPAGSLA